MIDLPDWGTPLRRMAGSLEKIAGLSPGEGIIETDASVDVPPLRSASEAGTEKGAKVDTTGRQGN